MNLITNIRKSLYHTSLLSVCLLVLSSCGQPTEQSTKTAADFEEPLFSNKVTLLEKPGSRALRKGLYYKTTDVNTAKDAFVEAGSVQSARSVRAKAFREYAKIQREEEGVLSPAAIKLLQSSVALGDAQASRMLAEYHAGRGEFSKAVAILHPIYHDYTAAKSMLGQIREYLRPGSGEALIDEAVIEYNAQLEAKDPSAHLALAKIHFNESLPQYNPKYALHHYEQAAKHGYQSAYAPLASIYREGRFVARDTEKAVYYYKKMAEMGTSHKSVQALSKAYAQDGWHRHDPARSYYWLEKTLQNNETNKNFFKTYMILAEYNLQGYGTAKDINKAKFYYDKALSERPEQTYRVAKKLYNDGSPQAQKLGYSYLQQARKRGDASANKFFVSKYLKNMSTLSEVNRVASYVSSGQITADHTMRLRIAEKYFDFAQLNKGRLWLKKAANAGSTAAMIRMAKLHAVGEGVTQSFAESQMWYEKAAQIGDSEAQYHTGLAYARGLGVAKDKKKAIYWLTRASDRGQSAARAVLQSLNEGDAQ